MSQLCDLVAGEEVARHCNSGFIEASPKDNVNVNEAFFELVSGHLICRLRAQDLPHFRCE